MSKIVEVSDATFAKEVLQSQQPVIVDFWAPWCGPCRAFTPVLDQLATSYEGKVKVAKLNVDENVETTAHYNNRGIPALLLFKDGHVADHMVGLTQKEKVDQSLTKVLV